MRCVVSPSSYPGTSGWYPCCQSARNAFDIYAVRVQARQYQNLFARHKTSGFFQPAKLLDQLRRTVKLLHFISPCTSCHAEPSLLHRRKTSYTEVIPVKSFNSENCFFFHTDTSAFPRIIFLNSPGGCVPWASLRWPRIFADGKQPAVGRRKHFLQDGSFHGIDNAADFSPFLRCEPWRTDFIKCRTPARWGR